MATNFTIVDRPPVTDDTLIRKRNRCNDYNRKKYIRALTYSGDYYGATAELWEQYWAAVERDDWNLATQLEEGRDPDFYYDP